jgi:hypothetical protein
MDGVTFLGFTPTIFTNEPYVGKRMSYTRCVPYSVYVKRNPRLSSIQDYYVNTIAQLIYNNRATLSSYEQVGKLFKEWVPYWNGNGEILKEGNIDGFVENACSLIDQYKEDWVMCIYDMEIRSHWYSLEVELEPDPLVRSKMKQELLSGHTASGIVQSIQETSEDYQIQNWGVLPTIPDITELTELCYNTIKKYGEGNYTSKAGNTRGRISGIKSDLPEVTEKEIAERLQMSLRTVRKYYNELQLTA